MLWLGAALVHREGLDAPATIPLPSLGSNDVLRVQPVQREM